MPLASLKRAIFIVAIHRGHPEGYREKGQLTPPAPPQKKKEGQFSEGSLSYPVIANGTLYIRDLGTLWAWDIKAR